MTTLTNLRRWFGMAVAAAVTVTPIAADTSPATAPTLGAAEVAELSKLYAGFEQTLRELPRDRFDPATVAEAVGRDADKLAAWVRDNTDPLPYRGALRGTTGVLMDRGGNSLDRSLLLAELMQSSGFETRLANATLPPATAQQVLAQASQPRKHASAGGDNATVEQARQRAKVQADRLLAAVGSGGNPAAENAARLAAVGDHWWVQRKQGDQWVDADVYGLSGLTPARTIALSDYVGRLPFDAADAHEVEFRAVIEVFRGGKLVTETVLKRPLRPADLLGKTVSFTHSIGSAIADADLKDDPASQAKLKTKLAAQETYIPILWIDERSHTEASFTTSGVVDRHPKMDPAGKLGGTVTDLFGGGLTGGGGSSGPAGVLTAEWMEYEIRVPGAAPKIVRRPVFDLIGPAARTAGNLKPPTPDEAAKLTRALALIGRTQVLLQPCDLSPTFALYQQARAEVRDKPVWLAVAAGGKNAPQQLEFGLQKLAMRDAITPQFAMIRQSLNRRPGQTFVDQPNIIHHRDLLEVAADGKIVSRSGMDLAFTSTAGLGGEAFAARLEQGVIDTLAEHLALGDRAAAGENTVGVFETAASAPAVVRSGDAAKLASLGLPADPAARATADLQSGQTLVLAGAASNRWTWWRVDPATGQTVGVMDSGFHQSLTEQEAQYEKQLFNFNSRLKTQIDKDTFLNMKPHEIEKWAGNKDITYNLQGLQKDWWGLIARRVGYAKKIYG